MAIILEADKVIEAVTALLKFLFATLGVGGTVAVVIVFIVVATCFRLYNDWKKDKEVNQALAEKDRTIARLAAQERVWRIQDFKAKGWTEDEIDKYLIQNEAPNIPAARQLLENNRQPSQPKGESV